MASSVPTRSPIVLVVEDEPILRMHATDLLERAGFDVVEAADAIEAVRILEQRHDIRLVFTDVDMPRGMDGIALAACVRNRWPPIHIIVTSGHVEVDQIKLPDGSLFFAKPYHEQDVVRAMRQLVGD